MNDSLARDPDIKACPGCGTRFEVRKYFEAGSAKVRCGRCRHVIHLPRNESPSSYETRCSEPPLLPEDVALCAGCGTRWRVTKYREVGITKVRCGRCSHVIDLTRDETQEDSGSI